MTRFEIRSTQRLAPGVARLVVQAPRPARHGRPGQFVIVRVSDDGERIPLTICDTDAPRDTITLVVQDVGATTSRLVAARPGDRLSDVVGPLGVATDIRHVGTVVVAVGGVGAAIGLPVARALAQAGNRVLGVMGARDAEHVILSDEFAESCDRHLVLTDDGSSGRRGLVTDGVAEMLETEAVHLVHTVGPVPMMRAVAEVTGSKGIPTIASLNPIMVDGTGMCGGCRVSVGGETRFACIDGPEFDAHLVDFDLLARRNRAYATAERRAAMVTAHE